MTKLKSRQDFFNSEQGISAKKVLQSMTADSNYNTTSTYSANSVRYPDNLIPFVDKHMDYMNSFPKLDPASYIANLKLRTRLN
ncbi:MAG TPA: hypothetical protein VLF63_02090 [Patescibacteria group bacterium]|nr:hypothetical protein [Patescibacteria group bacterium]